MIILGDFSVLCWKLYFRYKALVKVTGLGTDLSKQLAKLLWARQLNGGPVCIAPLTEYRLVLAMDHKYEDGGYWRTRMIWDDDEMQMALARTGKIGKYKGERRPKADDFLELYEIGIEYCKIAGFTMLSEQGFEADDFAGLFCRRFKHLKDEGQLDQDEELLLWTVDRDWSQLVDDEYNILFANTRVPKPTEVCQSQLVCNAEVAKHTAWKYGYSIDHPSELLEVKVMQGDAGDNIPPGECSRVYMDLLNPCPVEEYNLDISYSHQVRVVDRELKGEHNLQLRHYADAVQLLEQGRFKEIVK